MKNKKNIIILFFAIVCFFLFVFYQTYNNAILIEKKYSKSEIKDVVPSKTIFFEDFGLDNITCTGLTYDTYDNSFWIADYGQMNDISDKKPRIIEVDKEFNKVINIINLEKINLNTAPRRADRTS